MSSKPGEHDSLRKNVKAHLSRKPHAVAEDRPAEELLHELQVKQVELERQNKALREAQGALKRSRDRYLDIYEKAPIGCITLTCNGEIAEINPAGAVLLGEERGRLIGRSFTLLVMPGERERWHQIFMHTAQHGDQQSCELALQRGDGSSFHVQMDSLHLLDEGDVPMVRLMLTDITGRNRVQASERRLRHILDHTHDMIFIFDPGTLCFVYANKGAVNGVGYSREELLRMSPLDILQLTPEPEARAFIAPLISGKKNTRRFETIAWRKDGSGISVEAQLQFVQERGEPGLFVAILRDISRRRLAESELRRQKNLMWQVIDMDPNMIFVRDESGKFILANRAMAQFYGVTIQSLIGKTNDELDPVSRVASGFLASDRVVIEKSNESESMESIIVDGKQRWYRTTMRPFLRADGSANVLGIAVDISDLKLSETRLAESYKELQRLALHLENVRAEERAQIGRNLHDEMGATLAALKMRIAWLASKLPGELPYLSTELGHISDLVSDGIRTVRQVVTSLRPNLLDDVGLVAAVRDYVKKFQHDTEIACTLAFPDEDFTLFEEQSVTIFRIIQESLSNIAKHAQANKVEIVFAIKDHSLQLQVKDNGIGFDPAGKAQSFGLLGIKERARMIGGEAMIESTPGQGTRMSLGIPLPRASKTDNGN